MQAAPAMTSRVGREALDGGNARVGTREHAEQTAKQFEAMFIQQLVSSLRASSSISEDGGLFGNGTGSDTYAGWFDQHVTEHLGAHQSIGVQEVVIQDMVRHGQLAEAPKAAADRKHQLVTAQRAMDRSSFAALTAIRSSIDVAL